MGCGGVARQGTRARGVPRTDHPVLLALEVGDVRVAGRQRGAVGLVLVAPDEAPRALEALVGGVTP